jgi:hypothetical protein
MDDTSPIVRDAADENDASRRFLRAASRLGPRSSPIAGWFAGILFGIVVGLLALSPAQDIVISQLQLATAEESTPWVRAMDIQHSSDERSSLQAAAAADPRDYLLRVGSATALAEDTGETGLNAGSESQTDRTVSQLRQVALDFPKMPGGFAHLARYLMVDRVRIRRAELQSTVSQHERGRGNSESGRSMPAHHQDVRLMEWALQRGEALDPDNAFWPVMRATTYFAAMRDDDALEALHKAAGKKHWDAFIYEEVLGQWRLYSTVYRDYGATQKIGPLSLIAFPHLRELRYMAQMARWDADRLMQSGRDAEAFRIRNDISRVGDTIRWKASWAYEAIFGTDLFFIALTDGDGNLGHAPLVSPVQWPQRGRAFIDLVKRLHREKELPWMLEELSQNQELRQDLEAARWDSSYPGTPPGIPLVPLFGNWMIGIVLLQQIINFAIADLAAAMLRAVIGYPRPLARPVSILAQVLAAIALIAITTYVMVAMLSLNSGAAVGPAAQAASKHALERLIAALTLDAVLVTVIWLGLRHRGESSPAMKVDRLAKIVVQIAVLALTFGTAVLLAEQDTSKHVAIGLLCGITIEAIIVSHLWFRMRRKGPSVPAIEMDLVERKWSYKTTTGILFLLFVPAAVAVYWLLPTISGLHPVAQLLQTLMSNPPAPGPLLVIGQGLLVSALPLGATLLLGAWSLRNGIAPIWGILSGFRKITLPAITCLAICYLVMVGRTMRLDASASSAIHEAAKDEVNWVLTHSPSRRTN